MKTPVLVLRALFPPAAALGQGRPYIIWIVAEDITTMVGACARWVFSRLPTGPGILMIAMIAGCASVSDPHPISSKVDLDLGNVNSEGLRGPPDGLRAVHYEFCIPAGEDHTDEVRSIDPTAQFMQGSRGRIGCAGDQILVVGSTHQRSYRQVLERLAALEYVDRIAENFLE